MGAKGSSSQTDDPYDPSKGWWTWEDGNMVWKPKPVHVMDEYGDAMKANELYEKLIAEEGKKDENSG